MSMCECTSFILPLIVSVAECSDRDGEGLPHRVQCVLHHLSLVADGKPGDVGRQGFKILEHTSLRKEKEKIFPLRFSLRCINA